MTTRPVAPEALLVPRRYEEELAQAVRARALSRSQRLAKPRQPRDIVDWAQQEFLIPEGGPILLRPHQKAILRWCFTLRAGRLPFQTIIFSSIKKSGKTAISGLIGRYVAEELTTAGEIYFIGNDFEQAHERGYKAARTSIELKPGYNRSRMELPGEWRVRETRMVCHKTGTVIKPIPVDAPGEAGANPDLTVWCVTPETPVLTADLRWMPAGHIVLGDRLVGFDEDTPAYNCSRRYRVATVTAAVRKALPCYEIELDGDTPLRCTPEHRWLTKRRGQNKMEWRRTDELQPGDELGQLLPVWEPDRSYDAGYVAGAFDGEGHLSPLRGKGTAGGYTLGISQLRGKFLLEKVRAVLTSNGFRMTYVVEEPRNGHWRQVDRLRLDRLRDVVRLLGIYRPLRLLDQFSPDQMGHIRGCQWRRVLAVHDVGMQEMACIATDSKTYVARGYGAHNTELWGFQATATKRFWDEMTPVPTRPNSIRLVETYAGFEGESELLEELYKIGKEGRQVTLGELAREGRVDPQELSTVFPECGGNPDAPVPIWITGQMFMYWDSGVEARRMPWQQGPAFEAFLAQREIEEPAPTYQRLWFNLWSGAMTAAIPLAVWDSCYDPNLPPLANGSREPVVVGLDAAVSKDCFGIVAVTRCPGKPEEVAIRACRKFDPAEEGGQIDFSKVEEFLKLILANYNVVQFAYDPYQLEDMMQRMRREHRVWCEPFDQGKDRLIADSGLVDLAMKRLLHHGNDPGLREHVLNAAAKTQQAEDSKLRFVKKSQSRKIDLLVATSMAVHVCLHLRL